MKKVFVSGTYDILHAGHIEFFKQAKALGDYLIVSFASDYTLKNLKGRNSALPEEHKRHILESLSMVDEVVMGTNTDDQIFDFKDEFIRIKPQILASTDDDKHAKRKRAFCREHGATYVQLPKTLGFGSISTTSIRERIMAPIEFPLEQNSHGKKRIFISYRFSGESLSELIKTIRVLHDAIEVAGHHHYSTLFDQTLVDDNCVDRPGLTEKDMMDTAMKEMDSSDIILFFVKNDEVSKGMLIELGYAIAKNKKMVLAINKNVKHSPFRNHINEIIEFDSLEELKNKLSKEKFENIKT